MAIWDRRDDESDKAYAAFVIYRDMGSVRSIAGILTQNRHQNATKTPPTKRIETLKEWSVKFEWVKRATAYDEHLERQVRQKVEPQIIDEQASMKERHIRAGLVLQLKGVEHLENYPISQAADAIRAIKTGIDIERTAEGLPIEIIELIPSVQQLYDLITSLGKSPSVIFNEMIAILHAESEQRSE